MFLTVTANSALDRVIFIDEFVPQTVMRTTRYRDSVGGKGFDTSVVLRCLGLETVATGFVAGFVGQQLQQLLETYGIVHDLVWAGGETRIAHVISETGHGRHSHIITGQLNVGEEHYEQLLDRIRVNVRDADWVICGGSIPAETPGRLYADIIRLASEAGTPVLVDSSGASLRQAAEARPAITKMNRTELADTFGVTGETVSSLAMAADDMRARRGLETLVVTCGVDGVLLLRDDCRLHALPPRQVAVNAAGAGDAVSAALAWRLAAGDDWWSALVWAAAVSAAVVLTPGTADCRTEDVEVIKPDVQVFEV